MHANINYPTHQLWGGFFNYRALLWDSHFSWHVCFFVCKHDLSSPVSGIIKIFTTPHYRAVTGPTPVRVSEAFIIWKWKKNAACKVYVQAVIKPLRWLITLSLIIPLVTFTHAQTQRTSFFTLTNSVYKCRSRLRCDLSYLMQSLCPLFKRVSPGGHCNAL